MVELVTAACTSCKERIDFDQSEFEQSGEIDGYLIGQTIQCPHCGAETVLIIPKPNRPTPEPESPPVQSPPPVEQPRSEIPLNRNMGQCSDCGKSVSKNASACPHCGARQPKRTGVAAWGCLILAVPIMLMILAGVHQTADVAERGLIPAGEPKPRPGPAVLISKHGKIMDYGGVEITGLIHNNCNVELRRVSVRFSVFDKNGAKIGTARDYVDSIDADGDWKYRAVATEKDGDKFRLDDIVCSHGSLQYQEMGARAKSSTRHAPP